MFDALRSSHLGIVDWFTYFNIWSTGTKFRDEEEGFCNQQPFLTCLLQYYVHITGLQQADMMNNHLVDVQVAVIQVAFVTNEVNSTARDLPDLVYTPRILA